MGALIFIVPTSMVVQSMVVWCTIFQ